MYLQRETCGDVCYCPCSMVSSAVLLLDVVVVVVTGGAAAQELQIKDRADCTAQSVQLGTLTHCSVLQQQLQDPCRAVIHHDDCSK